MKILVVDDDPLAGGMTGAILEEAGHEAILAEHGVEALELLNAHPDVAMVVSDQNMPMVSGVELFAELRSQGVTLPFILLTGDDPQRWVQQAPGLDACLLKDADLEQKLTTIVNRLSAAANG